MAELGDAFDPKSYPGLFSELIPPDREAALATMMRENIRPATVRAAGYIGAETDLRPVLQSRHPVVVLPRLGHACVVEDPETCATEVRRFVATVTQNGDHI